MTTRENIALGAVANDGTGDNPRSAGGKINRNFARLFEWAGGDSGQITALVSFDSDNVVFEGPTVDAFETRLSAINPTADRQVLIPDASGTIVLTNSTDTLENKTLEDPVVTRLQINDADSSHQYTIVAGALSADHNINLPALTDSDTFALVDATQTLTNKSLTSPDITTPSITTGINDANGAEIISLTPVASAALNLTVANAAAGGSPEIGVEGSDSDVDMFLSAKNRGAVRLSKAAFQGATQNSAGTISRTRSTVHFTSGSGIAVTLADGSLNFEVKYLINSGAGTVTVTPTNFAQGTSFALAQNEAVQLIWNGSNWFIVGNQSTVTIT